MLEYQKTAKIHAPEDNSKSVYDFGEMNTEICMIGHIKKNCLMIP